MQLNEIVKDLKLSKLSLENISEHWKESEGILPDGELEFTLPEVYYKRLKYFGLSDFKNELLPKLDRMAKAINETPALRRFAEHTFYRAFLDEDFIQIDDSWPLFEHIFGKNGPLFYLLVVFGMFPVMRENHALCNIPEEISIACCSRFREVYDRLKRAQGYLGILPNTLYWQRHYSSGRLFRIGRFEYELCRKVRKEDVFGYRNKKTAQMILLAGDNIHFHDNGLCLQPDENIADAAFTSKIIEDEDSVCGYPVHPKGYVLKEKINLKKKEWALVFDENTYCLNMHIPAGSGLKIDVCKASFLQAVEFFNKYFPEKPFEVFRCLSWIFNTDIIKVLPDSNLAKFMKELYLYPYISPKTEGIFFTFDRQYDKIKKLPRENYNSLQNFMLNTLENGGRLRGGGMTIHKNDIKFLGNQYYQAKSLYLNKKES
jgi:GNAT domain-containint protein